MATPSFPGTIDEFTSAKRTLARTPEADPDWKKRVRSHADITGSILNSLQNAGYVRRVGANEFAVVGGSYVMGRAPTAGDDATKGAVVGQGWVNTATGVVYVCTDATASAAVWAETGGGTGNFASGGRYDLTATPLVVAYSTSGTPVEVTLSGWTADRDDLALYASGTPTRFTAATSGWYLLTAAVTWEAITGDSWLTIRRNTADDVVRDQRVHGGEGSHVGVSTAKYLTGGDYLQVVVQHFNDVGGTPGDVNLTAATFAAVLL
jgi:hypothetical protein